MRRTSRRRRQIRTRLLAGKLNRWPPRLRLASRPQVSEDDGIGADEMTQAADERIRVSRIVHTIHAVADIATCRARYLDVLGGLIFAEGYFEPEDRDMALLYVADHMIEPMAPRDPARLDKPYARYLQRFGEGLHSFEIMLENGPVAAGISDESE